MEKSVKLLICYHKKDVLLNDEIFTPIHVGRALAREKMGRDDSQFKWLCDNMIGDDTGDNISQKNPSYNELTAVYWAWKNYEKLGNPDYIGLMHYRRHFIFRESPDVVEEVRGIDGNYFNRINYSPEMIAHLFDGCDFVAHIGHVDEVYKHYRENHHIEDLDLAIEILKKKYPDAEVLAHPECKKTILLLADKVGSTAALLKHAIKSDKDTFIVATESGILHEMKKNCPDKTFIPAPPADSTCACNECSFMRLNTMEKLYNTLLYELPEIKVEKELADKAIRPIERMLEISRKLGL